MISADFLFMYKPLFAVCLGLNWLYKSIWQEEDLSVGCLPVDVDVYLMETGTRSGLCACMLWSSVAAQGPAPGPWRRARRP